MRRTFPALLLLLFGSSFAARPAAAEEATMDSYFWRDSNGKCIARCDARPLACCPCIIQIPVFTPFGPV
jgi:hypothetical protein